MESSRNFSRNKVGRNATVVLGNITVSANTPNADKSFLQAISKTDPAHDKNRILLLKGPLLWDAFNWIFGHQEFNKWRYTKESGVFWVKGDPGKGKTMLLCGIIEDLEQSPQNANLGYFFCQATDYRINTASAVVGGLIKSLLKRHPTLLSRIREKYADETQDELDGTNALVILCDIFETITNDPDLKDIICVVDALDECVKDCRYLIDFIVKTSGRVKWLLSSRNEKDIEKGLDRIPQELVLELKDNAEKISTSIGAYIRHHIQQIRALEHDEELRDKTLDILSNKAQGTFLWVALIVEQLHDTDHWDIENVLEEVPKDLESIYGSILDRTEKLGARGQEVCRVLLSVVTTAKRPLHLRELLTFINSHWKNSSNFKTTYQLRDIQDMAKTCGSILSIREDTVYFIHQSAKDYVVENAAQRIFPILHQHYKMFAASLDAMSSILEYNMYCLEDPAIHIDDVPFKDIGSDPFASVRYCCVFWVEHLVSGYQFEAFDYQTYLKDDEKLHLFLQEKFLCWIESLALMRKFSPQAQIALQKLKDLIDSYCCNEKIDGAIQVTQLQRKRETQGLRRFIDDAYHFVQNNTESVAHWPLQLYFSAISFEKYDNTIRYTFEQTIRRKFGPSPILASKQHSESNFRLKSSLCTDSYHRPRGESYKSLMFSPDSSLIGRLCDDHPAEVFAVWRADTEVLEHIFHVSYNSKIAFFPNSRDFISVSGYGIMKRWSMNKRSCVGKKSLNLNYRSLPLVHDSYVGLNTPKERVIALSPNGDLVASWHRISTKLLGFAKIWDTHTACCHSSCEYGEAVYIEYAAFSPNSQLLAVLYKNSFGIHNTKTGKVVQHIKKGVAERNLFGHRLDLGEPSFKNDDNPDCLCFSPNSRILATVEQKRQVCLWDTHTWELLRKIEVTSHFYRLQCLVISPDSTILATGSSDGTKLWNIKTGQCVAQASIFPWLIAFPRDWTETSLVALQPKVSDVQTWFIRNIQAIPEAQHLGYGFDNIAISPNSRFVASGRSDDNDVNIWSGDDGQLVHVLKGQYKRLHHTDILLSFSPDSKLLAFTNGSSMIETWCVATGKKICSLQCEDTGKISSIAVSGDPKRLIAGTFGGEMYIWRIDSGQLICKYDIDDQRKKLDEPLRVAISLESAHVATLWNSQRQYVKTFHLCAAQQAWTRPINCSPDTTIRSQERISFSSDSAILVTISEFTEFDVQIFDVATGACLQQCALGRTSMQLLSLDAIKGRIFTARSVLYKTSSWKHWGASPRLGYSYDYACIGSDDHFVDDKWITLNGKMNCYLPSNFRCAESIILPSLVAMSDSLLVFVNELGEVVIIKFPPHRKAPAARRREFCCRPII